MRRLVGIVLTSMVLASACSGSGPTLVATDATPEQTPAVTAAPTQPEVSSSQPDQDVEIGSPTPQPTEPPTITPPTVSGTSSSAPTPTIEPTAPPQQDCLAGLAGEPSQSSFAALDADGDGQADQMMVYRVGENASWRIRVQMASGQALDSPLGVSIDPAATVEALGGADINRDGTADELFTIVGSGASAAIVALHTRVGCNLVPVGNNGSLASFPIGGSVGNIAGLECGDSDAITGSFVAWTGQADFESVDGQYLLDGVEYRLDGSELVEVGRRSAVANIREADFVYGQLSCGAVNL